MDTGTGSVGYDVELQADWPTNADIDIYGQNVTAGAPVVYYGTSTGGGLALNVDAHSACDATPTPEIISGSFSTPSQFRFWYNQYSSCAAAITPSISLTVTNTGTCPLLVNGSAIAGGAQFSLSSIDYAGYDTGPRASFSGGTVVDVSVP